MIPTDYIIALVFTTLLLLLQLIQIPNRVLNTVIPTFLSLATAGSWTRIAVDSLNPSTLGYIGLVILGVALWCFLTIITWKEPPEMPEDNQLINYTPETLLSMRGTITSQYGVDSYLGALDDASNTNILVYLEEEEGKAGDIFLITSIADGKIYAKIIGHN